MPHTISRKSTKIDEISKWKSSEIKNFLFFQSLPVFIKFLPTSYFHKFASYIIAIRLLYEPIRNLEDLSLVETILLNYVKDLEYTFSIHAYTFTIHAHLHLVEQVRSHGPLQCHSAFFFEGALFNIKNLLHGTTGFLNQISKQIFLYKNLKDNFTNQHFSNESLKQFLLKKFDTFQNNRSELIGTQQKRMLNHTEKIIFNSNDFRNKYVLISDRVRIEGRTFHSKSYTRKGNCNSYTVSYMHKNEIKFADIEYFLELDNILYAFIKKHMVLNSTSILPESSGFFFSIVRKYFSRYYKLIKFTDLIDIIECSVIRNRCIIIENEEIFITELEYEYEHD
jgi:hypothetical protein